MAEGSGESEKGRETGTTTSQSSFGLELGILATIWSIQRYDCSLHPLSHQGSDMVSRGIKCGKGGGIFRAFPRDDRGLEKSLGNREFPFLFVQLANFMQRKPEPSESAWAELREAQMAALRLPNTGMAVAIDIGEANDIHPKNKQDVGKRLALAALAIAYGFKK
jgi:hypothetical protein